MEASSDLLELIYGSALDAGLWPRLLEELSDAFRGGATALLFQNQISMNGTAITARMDPGASSSFYSHFAARNPLTARNNITRMNAHAVLPINTDEQIVTKREFVRSEYYNDFMAPNDMHSVLMIVTGIHGMDAATLNIARPAGAPDFDSDAIVAGRMLQPHLARAFKIALELGQARQERHTMLDVMERSQRGVFLLDGDGRIRHANRAAEGLLGDGLTASNGKLGASFPDVARQLRQMITQAVSGRSGGSLSVKRPSLRWPLNVVIVPVNAEAATPFGVPGTAALLYVNDPEAEIALPEDGLRALFGLTAAETAVALKLLAGHDTKSIAQRLDLSVHTVRVHLSRIMSKTRTSRQAELMRLLMNVAGPA